jgi:Tfp pilus assembly protein PilO
MADFARMPTDRKVLTFAIIGLLLGGLYYQFAYKSLRDNVVQAQNQHNAKVMLNRKLDGDVPKFEALKAHMTVLRKIISENEQALPTSAELPAFFDTLNRKVVESGVEVKSWKRLGETKVNTFIRVPVEIEMTGTFMQIKKFFASLMPKKDQAGAGATATNGDDAQPAETERIISIENLSLTDPVLKNHEIVLTAHFIAATFRQEDHAAGATSPAIPAPAAPATAPASGAPAKLPPANTPAGAKARVQDALHKDDVRDRNAAGVDEAKTPAATPAPTPAPAPAGSANRLKGGL